MKFHSASRLPLIAAVATFVILAGCTTVREGPVTPPDPNARPIIIGKEPEHAPIPQKNVPEGESSLSHRKADERIDQPKN